MVLSTDSSDYHVITEAVKATKGVPGLTCEVGLRAGGGSEFIMRTLAATDQKDKTHIAIDPYGNIEYESHENVKVRLDYTNDMRDICIKDMYDLAYKIKVNFLFFPLEDSEFFARYADGVPLYREHKVIENRYSFVHFDGPHARKPLEDELEFFSARVSPGGMFVFDDVRYYDHEDFEKKCILPKGFTLVAKTGVKASYRYTPEA